MTKQGLFSTCAPAALMTLALLPACGAPASTDPVESVSQPVINGKRLPTNSYRSALVYTTPDFVSGSTGWLCSGTVVGPHHILTAAHCVGKLDMVMVGTGADAFEKEVFRPEVADEMKPGKKLRVTNARSASTLVQYKPWLDVTIKKSILSPPWVQFAKSNENSGYGDLLDAGRADLAIIETVEEIGKVVAGIVPATVDTQPVAADADITLVGFGCEKWELDAEGNVTDNWGTRVTGEYGRTKTMSAQKTAELDWAEWGDWYTENGYTLEDVVEYYATVSQGYRISAGPAIPPEKKGKPRAGICPGDSGGGVYRGTGDSKVVGVNSGFFSDGEPGPASLSVYGRTDGEGGVARWLKNNLPKVL